MLLNPDDLNTVTPAEVLEAAARGHLGLDHRFLHAILDRREEALPALLEFAKRDRSSDPVDLAPELISIFRYWKTPESIPFFVSYIEEAPTDIPDEVVEALVELGPAALDPLLALYSKLEEDQNGEVAFVLANLPVKDDRILQLLLDRLEFDLADTALLLGMYGDERARKPLEAALASLSSEDADLKEDLEDALDTLLEAAARKDASEPAHTPPDIWSNYPERADPPLELLDEDERLTLLRTADSESLRAAAASSFFNSELSEGQQNTLLEAARTDTSPVVRARAWEALMLSIEDEDVMNAMLAALRSNQTSEEERAGLVVALSSEADRNEVREAILRVYQQTPYRAKALEAMWRSLHSSFRDYFAPHLNDPDVETRRSAIWGVGYFRISSQLDRLRKFFHDEELRSDALFAYALALPGETSRGRVQSYLSKIEKDAHGLSELEEDLVQTALDERLLLAGKEPVFALRQD